MLVYYCSLLVLVSVDTAFSTVYGRSLPLRQADKYKMKQYKYDINLDNAVINPDHLIFQWLNVFRITDFFLYSVCSINAEKVSNLRQFK